ncbi:MAG TPA: Mur ligase family protein, partial [Casimicrobiaceae bacterium]|nr:Mur ligase family protein [Casimicrobiaceae bacterium]
IGVPLTLLRLRQDDTQWHRAGVVELGMNHPGEIAALAAMAAPTVALVNNAQREHQEFMKTVAEVAAEHAALVRALPDDGVAVLNADDPSVGVWRSAARERGRRRVVDFALERAAAVGARLGASAPGASVFDLLAPQGEASVRLHAPGRHNVANALAAAAATLAVGVPPAAVAGGLTAFRPLAGRLAARSARSGAAVIDDSYNANPDSVRAAIDVLAGAPPPRWLVLGDMGEVGEGGPGFHREVGEYARRAGIERLFTAGALAAEAAAAFGAGAAHFASVDDLSGAVAAGAARGTTVLVKGSRFMRMERVVAALAGEGPVRGPH